jgi:Xylose isomerase-like TIM barrel.
MARIPIALQLYSVREDAARDLQGVLAAVADMGYEVVEFAGYYGHDAHTIRRWLDAYGLRVAGAHVGIDTLIGDERERTVEFHQVLGNTTLVVPGLAEQWRSSRAAWLKTAATLNEIAAALKPYRMRTGYHNHHIEFVPMEGELPWDTLFSNTTDDVIMQFDTGNALYGGAQAAPFLRRYPDRARTVHLKEYSATSDAALIGEGDVSWAEVFELCETIGGTEWCIVEQESYAYPPLECVRRCLQALKAMGR